MVFNTTFNNISVISWRSVFLVEETGARKILSNSYKMAVVVVQSVPISTKVVSSNPAPDEM
jgi:hypothetical protein